MMGDTIQRRKQINLFVRRIHIHIHIQRRIIDVNHIIKWTVTIKWTHRAGRRPYSHYLSAYDVNRRLCVCDGRQLTIPERLKWDVPFESLTCSQLFYTAVCDMETADRYGFTHIFLIWQSASVDKIRRDFNFTKTQNTHARTHTQASKLCVCSFQCRRVLRAPLQIAEHTQNEYVCLYRNVHVLQCQLIEQLLNKTKTQNM